jgi:hypothetical protein
MECKQINYINEKLQAYISIPCIVIGVILLGTDELDLSFTDFDDTIAIFLLIIGVVVNFFVTAKRK